MIKSSGSNGDIKQLSQNLAARAESFCRHFFPQGLKQGNYWQIGDTSGIAGKSLAIRLSDSGGRKAGNWTDYASGEYGDLIDLLHANQGTSRPIDTFNKCRSFLGEASVEHPSGDSQKERKSPSDQANDRITSARKLFGIGKPTYRTLASAYLLSRGIKRFGPALRYHPSVYVRPDDDSEIEQHPALLAKITNNAGIITGVARTFLNPDTKKVAAFDNPKRVLGQLYGNAIRFGAGTASEDLIVGEGLENVLSVGTALPDYDLASCLTANHLSLFDPPDHLKRIWIARDNDKAGEAAARRLRQICEHKDICVGDLVPQLEDFNKDLQEMGLDKFRERILTHLYDG